LSREKKALEAIKNASNTELGECSIDEFVSHHLEELPIHYWEAHLDSATPSSEKVIGLLILSSEWDDEEVYDFTLPDEVTDYVVSVSFDEDGNLENITMES
tara:strand:+ start:466 stop:768 length:303 start_codon:yes stop_codon:yes gene_type:complete